MADPDLAPNLQRCHSCGAIVDMSEEQPLRKVRCSICGAELTVQRSFPNYDLIDIVGEGGMGTVYRARDKSLQRMIALKLLNRTFTEEDQKAIDTLMMEARMMASLNHENIVRVFTSGMDQGNFFVAMELMPSGSLDDLMEAQGRLPESQVLQIAIDVAKGLKAAQEEGLIHRDVKPGNILFGKDGSAKVVDFGLARYTDELENSDKSEAEIWGTPYYVPPETLNRESEDFRSDIYSLGATIFHAMAGRPPFEAENASLVAIKHLKNQAVSLISFAPHVSDESAYVVNRMLHKNPDERFNDYEELIEHLEYALEHVADQAQKKAQMQEQAKSEQLKTNRLFGLVTLGLVFFVLAAGVTGFLLRDKIFQKGPDKSTPAGQLEIGRMAIKEGKMTEARSSFNLILGNPDSTQIERYWAHYFTGLTYLLQGQVEEANLKAYRPLEGLDPARLGGSDDPADLLDFFQITANQMVKAGPVPESTLSQIKSDNIEILALLALGLKNWSLGAIEDSYYALSLYEKAQIEGEFAWADDFDGLIQDYLHDGKLIADIVERADEAEGSKAKAQSALKALETTRPRLRLKGRGLERLAAVERILRDQVRQGS